MENKTCQNCGRPITERTSHNVKYCSAKCARYAEHRKHIDYIAKRAKGMSTLAQRVCAAYGRKCAICKWQATPELIRTSKGVQQAHGNEIHHIIPVSKGGADDESNLILLCPNHHKQADLGLIDIETLKGYAETAKAEAEKEKAEALGRCADRVARAIFGSK